MKISTITCHNVYNHGASLQAYALQEYLKSLDNKVEIIDYQPERLRGKFNFLVINNDRYKSNVLISLMYILAKFPIRLMHLKRKRSFDLFNKKYLSLSSKKYINFEQLLLNPPSSDIYICGSDQIWNPLYGNGSDPAFFLKFGAHNIRRVSYAASMAVDQLDDDISSLYKKNLNNFYSVGVRESSAKRILEEIGVKNVVHVLDPVFLHPEIFWRNLSDKEYTEKYILVQDFDNNPEIEKISLKLAKKYGAKIYSLNKVKYKYYDKEFNNSGPIEMINLIKNAEFVISNSFHAVCFSIILRKQFFVFNRNETINTRMRDLLISLGIQERLIVSKCITNLNDEKISYENVYDKLQPYINESKQFLKGVLG